MDAGDCGSWKSMCVQEERVRELFQFWFGLRVRRREEALRSDFVSSGCGCGRGEDAHTQSMPKKGENDSLNVERL